MSDLASLILRAMRITTASAFVFLAAFVLFYLVRKVNMEGAIWPLTRQDYGVLGLMAFLMLFAGRMFLSMGREIRNARDLKHASQTSSNAADKQVDNNEF